jgi:hypothetical protein
MEGGGEQKEEETKKKKKVEVEDNQLSVRNKMFPPVHHIRLHVPSCRGGAA